LVSADALVDFSGEVLDSSALRSRFNGRRNAGVKVLGKINPSMASSLAPDVVRSRN